jgi:hypothetical protein
LPLTPRKAAAWEFGRAARPARQCAGVRQRGAHPLPPPLLRSSAPAHQAVGTQMRARCRQWEESERALKSRLAAMESARDNEFSRLKEALKREKMQERADKDIARW